MAEETDFDSNVRAQPFLSCVTTGERFLNGEDTAGVVTVSFFALKTAAHTCTYRHAHTFTHTCLHLLVERETHLVFSQEPHPSFTAVWSPMCVNDFSISREVNSV